MNNLASGANTTRLFNFRDARSANLQNKTATGAILLDLQKAFDTVWPNGLIYKLTQLSAPGWVIHVVHNFLFDRSFAVQYKHKLS